MLRLLHPLVVTLLMVLLPSILFTQVGPPDPPSSGPNGCAEAPLICDITTLSGYQGGTGVTGSGQPCPFSATGSTCPTSTCENNIWFNFFANATTMDIEIMVSNCEGGQSGNGLQGAMYQVTDCSTLSGFIPVSNCFSNNTPTNFTLNATGLVIGEIYTIMLDGFSGSICQFEIGEIAGPNVPFPEVPGPLEGPLEVCPGAVVEYCMPTGIGIQEYQWTLPPGAVIQNEYLSPDGSMICIEVEFTGPGGGALEVLGINECYDDNYGTNFQVLAPIVSAPIIIPPVFDTICLNETYTWECHSNVGPGYYECAYESWLGCDSILSLTLLPHPPTPIEYDFVEMCGVDVPFIWNGSEYNETGNYTFTYNDVNGCEVTDILDLFVFESESIIAAPDVISCGQDSIVTLDGTLSTSYPQDSINGGSVTYLWTTPDGNILSDPTQITVDVNAVGEYFLEVTHSNFTDTVSCLSISSVIVIEDDAFPNTPDISGIFDICGTGQMETYTPIPSPTGVPANGYVWTVTGGTLTTSGNDATVTWASAGQICLAAYNECDTSDFTCIDVTVGAVPVIPAIDGPTTVCETNDSQEYSIVANDWIDVWTVTGGATFVPNPGSNLITVDFTGVVQPSVDICVTAENDCGTSDPLCQTITVIQVPNDPMISGDDAVCLDDTETYSIGSDPAILSIVATVPGGLGTIISGQGTTDVVIEWTSSGSDQVCFEVSNPCGSANVVCQDITISNLPTASLVDGDIYYCPGSSDTATVNITLTGSSPWEVVLTDGTNPTTYYLTDVNSSIDIVGAGSYTISSVVDGNTCIGSGTGQINIIEHTAPTALLSGSGGICEDSGDCIDLTVDLDQEPGWTIVYAIDGIEQAPVPGIMNSSYTLTLCQSGTVTLVSVEDGNGCSGTVSGTVLIDNLTTPTANVETYCEPNDDTQYFVSIELQGGDPSSYTVLPVGSGTIVGNVFTSNPIPSGIPYNFQVFDGNACETIDLSGNYVCNCGNDVGVMDQTLLNVCDPDCAIVVYDNTNEVLATGDIAQYVLHEGADTSIVNPLSFNVTGEFCFDSGSMVYGQTYYISRITGDDDGNGNVDFTDPCFAIAQGTPVIFFEIPAVTIGAGAAICIGESFDISIDFTTGDSPWSIVYDAGSGPDTLSGIQNANYLFNVAPTATTSYCFTEVFNANCSELLNTCVDIIINEPPSVNNISTNCNDTADGFTVSFEIIGGNPMTYEVLPAGSGTLIGNIFTSNEIPEGDTYFFEVTNGYCTIIEVSDPNPVDCPCLTSIGNFNESEMNYCFGEPIVFDTIQNYTLDGNDVLNFVLVDDPLNYMNPIMTASTPYFDYDPNLLICNTPYYILGIAGNDIGNGLVELSDECLVLSDPLLIQIQCPIELEMIEETIEICMGDQAIVNTQANGDGPFILTFINPANNTEELTGIFNGDQLVFEPTVSGIYQLIHIAEETSALLCENTLMDVVEIIVFQPSNIGSIAASPQFCEGEEGLVLLSDLLEGEDEGGLWIAAGSYFGFNATLGTFNPEGNLAGEYQFTYTLAGEASCPETSIIVSVTINPLPTANAGNTGWITCNESEVLLGGAGSSQGDEYLYSWTLNGNTIAGAESSTYEATSAGTYELYIENSITGCSASDMVLVENIVDLLIPEIQFNDPLCFEEENGSINVVDVLGGQGPYLYSFDGGQTFSSNSDMDGLGSSTYSVIVQDVNGCESQQVEVTLESPGELVVELEILNEIQEDNSIMYGDSVVLFANVNYPAADITYDWMPGCDTCGSIYVLNPTTTTMVNISIDANGCDADDRLLILVRKNEPVFVPTVFSPNGDNVNDVLNIYIGEFVKEIKSFQIYDRWGELMHTRTNFVPTNQTYDDSAWDGTLNGKSCGAGVYVYFIEVEFQDGRIEMYKGDITLTR